MHVTGKAPTDSDSACQEQSIDMSQYYYASQINFLVLRCETFQTIIPI